VEKLVHRAGLHLERRSRLAETAGQPDVLLLDTLGELAGIYGSAAGCFIGGTLVPTGGHNPLEAARHGVAIAVGPSMENFREIAAAFDAADAWRRVPAAEQLAETWARWLEDPASAAELGARGASLIQENQGALEKTLQMLGPLLGPFGPEDRTAARLPT
jgi:3-deoxy-D-manno-octulosonic-acid transferase